MYHRNKKLTTGSDGHGRTTEQHDNNLTITTELSKTTITKRTRATATSADGIAATTTSDTLKRTRLEYDDDETYYEPPENLPAKKVCPMLY